VKGLSQVTFGLGTAFFALLLVLGALGLSLAENRPAQRLGEVIAPIVTPSPPEPTASGKSEAQPTFTETLPTASITPLPPSPVTATPTLTETPTPTEASQPIQKTPDLVCGPPKGWVIYVVRAGDNLYKIASATVSSVGLLQQANCLGSSTIIRPGQRLFVPRLPVWTPTPTIVHPTEPPTRTPAPPEDTPIPTETTPSSQP
jgi:LysM repeat protein